MAARQRERSPKPKPGYEVGYGKPPKQHRFRKGQSGNPKGRPKGSRNLETIIMDKLDEHITYSQNGVRRTATRREVFGERLITDALAGKPAATRTLLQLEEGFNTARENANPEMPSSDSIKARDRAILKSARSLGYLPSEDTK